MFVDDDDDDDDADNDDDDDDDGDSNGLFGTTGVHPNLLNITCSHIFISFIFGSERHQDLRCFLDGLEGYLPMDARIIG